MLSKTISLLGTKGGILKTTIVKTLATSRMCQSYKVGILEVDPQGNIKKWLSSRSQELPKLDIVYNFYDSSSISLNDQKDPLEIKIEDCASEVDLLFLDFPGESESRTRTRIGLSCSDLCLLPLSLDDNDLDAFDEHLRQDIDEVLKFRDSKHFRILPIKAHHSADREKFLSFYSSIKAIELMKNIHKDRKVYTYFTMRQGLTLDEYAEIVKKDEKEYIKTQKAIRDIDIIMEEILTIIN